jgi:hypothetical protein
MDAFGGAAVGVILGAAAAAPYAFRRELFSVSSALVTVTNYQLSMCLLYEFFIGVASALLILNLD